MRRGLLIVAAFAALAAVMPGIALAARTEVVVELDAPPLARAIAGSRALSAAARERRLDLRSPTSVAYLRGLTADQRRVEARIERSVPSARVRWRYQVVLNALAVDLPVKAVRRLERLAGVADVTAAVGYRSRLDHSSATIGAPFLWGTTFSTIGQGLKIGIIDDGVDQTHPFFDPTGFTMPAGFPRGNRRYTTRKVIVARAFAPPRSGYSRATLPFDPRYSFHGTHVAGIAAGDRETLAAGRRISGLAPGAYIGNYKVLTVPADSYDGLDGNSPEIARAIEAAVRDGMDVINLSLGEPEVTPSRDLAARAINAAVDAGVVAAISAGNSFELFGRGTIWSPATAEKAITVAAASDDGELAGFSSSGPTPLSLRLKPDVTAPGVGIFSSVPRRDGTWDSFDGTSMAAPHVAGAAAVLRQRHPSWTPAQIKSALALTGTPVTGDNGVVPTTRQGGGMIDLEAADDPLVFAAPTGLSFGLLQPRRSVTRSVALTDAGGGTGVWSVQVADQPGGGQAQVTAPQTVSVPGSLTVTAAATAGAREGEVTGYVVLRRGEETRRIAYWFRVASFELARHRHRALARTGTYRGNTRGQAALVSSYRYPDNPRGVRIPVVLAGPEQVFRVTVRRRVANFGVRILSRNGGVTVEPRIVAAGNEHRLATETALPLNVNPYFDSYFSPMLAAGVLLPAIGAYDVVLDSPTRGGAGAYRFRFWLNDTTPPSVRLLTRSVARGGQLRLRLADHGSGVWPDSLSATIDGKATSVVYSSGRALLSIGALGRGVHRLVFRASDYQETRNHENVYRILPNTRALRTTFVVR